MASFIGTYDDFIKYINPRAKNVVNSFARQYKSRIDKCEHCSSTTATLEAAHITGRERLKIIEGILDNFTNGDVITIDLEVFEIMYLTAHEPIEDNILVLCRECHRAYDASDATINNPLEGKIIDEQTGALFTNSEITEYLRKVVPLLTNEEVGNLESPDYCRLTFGVNYAVLKSVPMDSDTDQVRRFARINGYNRWSTQRPVVRSNKKYLVMTQWIDRHRTPFMEWKIKIDVGIL